MAMYGTYEWAAENEFSTAEVIREIRKHGHEPDDFFRDMTGSPTPTKDTWPGADVLGWLGY